MPIFEAIQQNPALAFAIVVFVGACIGSFLNVVIYRLPIMMFRQWHEDLNAQQEQPIDLRPNEKIFNLAIPNSRCSNCGASIKPWQNIPVISYVFLRGRCASCSTPISKRYPLVEAATALASLYVFHHFGVTWQCLFALLFTWCLIALTMIDYDHQLLPDSITLPLLWLGLLINGSGIFVSLHESVYGAAAGYMTLWCVYWLFRIVTGKEGMGFGDFKLLAAIGAWFGWKMLPLVILLSSGVGAVIGITLIVLKRQDKTKPIPFGPYLAIAAWIAMLHGTDLTNWYLGFMQVR
jgi:leader peptidase (prepilin peptidase) / N-methyltransferase